MVSDPALAPGADRANRPGVAIEDFAPLSESLIWRVQQTYYEDKGVDAWASGEVPYMLTSGPMLARAYARLVEGYVADCLAGRLGSFDPTEPLYVVELGAGPGRLAFQFLAALDRSGFGPLQVVYVLTDLVAANREFWTGHPKLAPYFAAGQADFARLVVGEDDAILLEGCGRRIGAGDLANPLVAIANYCFDVIPQDLYAVADGTLFEELVSVCVEDPAIGPDAPDFFRRVFLATARVTADPGRHGERLGALLEEVARARTGGDRRLLFPALALSGLEHLLAMSADRLLVLIGERPGGLPEQTPDLDAVAAAMAADPEIPVQPASVTVGTREAIRPGALLSMGVHGGSMSLPVDLDIVERAVAARGGSLLAPSALASGLRVGALLVDHGAARATRERFQMVIEDVGPEDLYLTLKAALEDGGGKIGLAMLLALMRISGYDPYLLRQAYGAFERELAEQGEEIDPAAATELVRVLGRVEALDYPLDAHTDVAYGIAVLLAPIGCHEAALEFFARSRARVGPRPAGLYNVALCHLHLEDADAALEALEEAIALDPGYEPARVLRDQVQEERARLAAEGPVVPEGPHS